ncbi:type III restriction endonuclease subunit R, partial [Chloroflexota bacterium]
LTNIHRVFASDDSLPSPNDDDLRDYFLGARAVGATTDSGIDLGTIIRDVDELAVLNDEAHHIHDPRMAWFKSIEDIHNRLKQKGSALSLQVDVTATPKHNNGAIFVQTIADYPLVEAISQNVVKHPVLPDAPSRAKLQERKSAKYTEKYADYVHLGVVEWRKAYDEHLKVGMKAVLFVMTDDTRNCDEVASYLEATYPELKGAVLTIHTKKNGDISETATGKDKEELDWLREQANSIDSFDSKYKAVVSVMVLKEGWDVRNVTTIVGLRPYSAKSNILPEQTLGRGLRKMYPGDVEEYLSVVGTDAFMDFVESIQAEGVVLERRRMGDHTEPTTPLVVEVDRDNTKKDIDALDIRVPVLTPRAYREYKNLASLNVGNLGNRRVAYRVYRPEELREIIFKDITTGEVAHVTLLDAGGVADYRSVLGYFAQTIMGDLRLVSGYDVLYGKLKTFVRDYLFDCVVDLEAPNTLRNLSEVEATRTLIEAMKKAINALTVQDRGDAEIRDTIKLRETRPFVTKAKEYLVPKKSVFNRIVGDSHFELLFARFLDECPDVVAFAKNYFAVRFKLDYVNIDGDISNYYPDFIVRTTNGSVFIVETKGQEDLDVPLKMARLAQWCQDVNEVQQDAQFDFVYVDMESFEGYRPRSFAELDRAFREYRT